MSPSKSQKIRIPPGAAIYGAVTQGFSHSIRTVYVHGLAGPYMGILVKRGTFEAVLPGASFVVRFPEALFVAWDGEGYVIRLSLLEIQSDCNLTLIGGVEGIPTEGSEAIPTVAPAPPSPPRSARMPSTVYSPAVVKKIDAFMAAKGMDQTEFAIQANTTDKTIRKIRNTSTIKRSMLKDIAKAIGITREELLKES